MADFNVSLEDWFCLPNYANWEGFLILFPITYARTIIINGFTTSSIYHWMYLEYDHRCFIWLVILEYLELLQIRERIMLLFITFKLQSNCTWNTAYAGGTKRLTKLDVSFQNHLFLTIGGEISESRATSL